MGRIDELKIWQKCKREGQMEEYELYKKSLEANKKNIEMWKRNVKEAEIKLKELREKFPENSPKCEYAKKEVSKSKFNLEKLELSSKFIRPNTPEDISYRDGISSKDFIEKLQEVTHPNLDLRFHGTPIYFAEQIIKSGGISSTADRKDGYMRSTDQKGEISASTIKSLGRTMDFFLDMGAYIRNLPGGVIFAILPKDEADANFGIDLLHSVNFKENPEQLFGLITTPENIGQVTEWMEKSGFHDKGVYTFEGFVEAVKEKSEIIDEQSKSEDKEKKDVNISNKINIKQTNEKDYLFGEDDAKEIAISKDIRFGRMTKLQEKIKNAVKELRNKFIPEKLKGGEKDTNDEPNRD